MTDHWTLWRSSVDHQWGLRALFIWLQCMMGKYSCDSVSLSHLLLLMSVLSCIRSRRHQDAFEGGLKPDSFWTVSVYAFDKCIYIRDLHWLKISALNAVHALPGYQTHESGVASAEWSAVWLQKSTISCSCCVSSTCMHYAVLNGCVPLWDVLINDYSAILSFSLPHVIQTCMTFFILSLKHKRRWCRTGRNDVKCQSKDIFENMLRYDILFCLLFLLLDRPI